MNLKGIEYKKNEQPLDLDELCDLYLALAHSQMKTNQFTDSAKSYEEALNCQTQ